MTLRRMATVVLVLAALSGCGQSQPDATGPRAPRPGHEEVASRPPTAAPAVECLEVSATVLSRLQQGAEDGMTFTEAAAYRSPDFVKIYFVAARFTVPGVDNAVGVWVTNSISDDESAGVMAVDAVAVEFTDWGPASTTDAAITVTDPSVSVATDCLG